MNSLKIAAVCLLISVLAGGPAAGQQPDASQTKPILKLIPAGSVGYVVVHDVKKATDIVDRFLKETGLTQFVEEAMPAGCLKAVLSAARLGEGFNPAGGAAVVMLDPNQFGIDLIKLMKSAMSAGGAATAPAKMPKLPFVVFVPGTGVNEMFGKYDPKPAEGYDKLMSVSFGGVDMFAMQHASGYVLLSPNAEALAAVAKADKRADAELTGRHKQIVTESAAAVYINARLIAPTALKAIKAMELMAEAHKEGLVDDVPPPVELFGGLKPQLGYYKYILGQLETISLGVRTTDTGVLVDGALTYLPDSQYGKALAAFKAPAGNLLDNLPNVSYVMAAGQTVWSTPGTREAALSVMDALLDADELKQLPRATRDKAKQLATKLLDEITGVQFVMNGVSPEAKGVFNCTLVLKCKDAEKLKSMISEVVGVVREAVEALLKGNGDLKGMKLAYKKNHSKIGDVQVDAIVLDISETDAAAIAEEVLRSMFGEPVFQPLVAASGKGTVVISVGGGAESLTAALKVAGGKGKILADKDAAEALKHMPRNADSLMLFSIPNYYELIMAAMGKMGGGAPPVDFRFTCKTPIAAGSAIEGAGQVFSVYVPTKVVAETVKLVQTFIDSIGGPGPGPGPQRPVPGGEDF